MKTLDIHFEGATKLETLDTLLENRIPFNLSFTPYDVIDKRWGRNTQTIVNLVKEGIKQGSVTLAQQGYKHKCKYEHKIADPWHENFCFYNKLLSLEEQLEIMRKGKEIVEDTFGATPIIYSPPNHMYDRTTLKAAWILGYKFLTDLALISLNPYNKNDVVVIPESKVDSIKTDVVYLHYDEIDKYSKIFWNILAEKLRPMQEIKGLEESSLGIAINTRLKHTRKIFRDVNKLLKR